MRDRKKARARKREREAQKILNKLKGVPDHRFVVCCDLSADINYNFKSDTLKEIVDEIDREILQQIIKEGKI